MLFRHVSLQVFAPSDPIVEQDTAPTDYVYVVLNGSCDLTFQSTKLLTALLERRNETTPRQTSVIDHHITLSVITGPSNPQVTTNVNGYKRQHTHIRSFHASVPSATTNSLTTNAR